MPENKTGITYEDRLGEILETSLSNSDISLCLASSEEDEDLPAYRDVSMLDALADEFRDVISAIFLKRKRERSRGDLVIRPYQAESKLDKHEIEFVDISQTEFIGSQLQALANLHDIQPYTGDAAFVQHLRFYAIVVQPPSHQPIYCFRWYTPKRELSRSKLFGAIQAGGQYDKFREPLLLFDDHIDCFGQGDSLFILNKDRFQRIFQYFEMVRQVAIQTISTIKTHIPIANFDEFETVCHGNVNILAKLRNISQSPYIHSVTPVAIKDTIERLNIDVAINDDDTLVFDPKKKWEFFRLLEDGYLQSPMTGQNYEVNSKRVIGGA